MSTTATRDSITPAALADRLAGDEPVTILDLRDAAPDRIEGPAAKAANADPMRVLAIPETFARELGPSVAVVCARGRTALPVAAALRRHGTDARALEGGIRGWIGLLRALPLDLGVEGLEARQVQRPGRGCLSYVLAAGGRALVVDPAPDSEAYVEIAGDLGARIVDVVDTHLHADHISGARALAALTGATLRMPAGSLERGVDYADEVEPLADGDSLALGPIELRAIALPGHTTDMTGLLVGDRALIAGDSLFADGIARPDLERGDAEGARAMARTLHETLRGHLLGLGDDVVLLPGHDHPGVRATAVAPRLGEVRERVAELSIADPDRFAETIVADLPPRPANYESVIAVNAGRRPPDAELEVGGNACATR